MAVVAEHYAINQNQKLYKHGSAKELRAEKLIALRFFKSAQCVLQALNAVRVGAHKAVSPLFRCGKAVHKSGLGRKALDIRGVKVYYYPLVGNGQVNSRLVDHMVAHQQDIPWLELICRTLDGVIDLT